MRTGEASKRVRQITNLFKIFYSPEEVFQFQADKAEWLLPMVLTSLLSCLLVLVMTISVDTKAVVRKQLESKAEFVQQVGKDKIDEIVEQSDSPSQRIISYVLGGVIPPVAIVAIAGLLTGTLFLLGSSPQFRNVLSVAAYSYYAYYAVTFVLWGLLLLPTKDKSEIDINSLLKSNLGALLDKGSTGDVLFSLASSLDVLTLGLVFLIGFGLSKTIGRLSFMKAVTAVAFLWLAYVAAKAGLSIIF
jgi:hypothetical protein